MRYERPIFIAGILPSCSSLYKLQNMAFHCCGKFVSHRFGIFHNTVKPRTFFLLGCSPNIRNAIVALLSLFPLSLPESFLPTFFHGGSHFGLRQTHPASHHLAQIQQLSLFCSINTSLLQVIKPSLYGDILRISSVCIIWHH